LKASTPNELPDLPALIFFDEQTGGLRVAALTLLDRLVVTAHRAGAGPITVVAPEAPSGLQRTTALGIPLRVTPNPPARNGAALVACSNLLVQTADVRALLRHGGRLATGRGSPLPIGVLPPGDTSWEHSLNGLPIRAAKGVACRVADADTARQAENALWASLTSSSDGLVDRAFNRPCGRPLSKFLVHTPITPNAVTLASIAIGLVAAWFFAIGTYAAVVFAAILFQLSTIVDCVDGDLARSLFKESPFGKWLDLGGDQVVHVAVFAAIAVGLVQSGQSPYGLWLGLSAVLGALLSFAVVVQGLRHPANHGNGLLSKLIDSATNRDFSVLILMLAGVGRLGWFLWMTAIGSHLFWMTALALQLSSRSAGPRAR
jgi:phosphatidylglycerophosphate synthase